MSASPNQSVANFPAGAFVRDSQIGWIASKIAQSIGVEAGRMDAVHTAIWNCIIGGEASGAPRTETDQLAIDIVAVARVAGSGHAVGGRTEALAQVMRESGVSLDPMLAQNFMRLASSSIFWIALDSVSDGGRR